MKWNGFLCGLLLLFFFIFFLYLQRQPETIVRDLVSSFLFPEVERGLLREEGDFVSFFS
jgi:hypothetical protein